MMLTDKKKFNRNIKPGQEVNRYCKRMENDKGQQISVTDEDLEK